MSQNEVGAVTDIKIEYPEISAFAEICQDIDKSVLEDQQRTKKRHEGHTYRILLCTQCGYAYLAQLNCGDRTCPICRKKWYGYHFRSLSNIMATWKNVRTMTLTLKNIESAHFSRESVKSMRKAFTRLLHRKYFKAKIKGGFYFVHITNYGKGFHLHFHVVYEGEWIDQKKLSQTWKDLTKGSYIVYLQRKNVTVKKALKYLLSDLLQKPKILDEYISQYNEVMRGTRLVQGFGKYAHTKLREKFICPVCNNDEWYCPHYDQDLYNGIYPDDTS